MTGRARVGLAAAATLAAGIAVTWWLWPSVSRPDPQVGGEAGAGIAAALGGAMAQADRILEAHRCARLEPPAAAPERELAARARRFTVRGDTLVAAGAGPLVVAVVADSRGATPPTLARIAALRPLLQRAGVQLVISLGGLGTSRAEIAEVLRALGGGAPWAVLAIPGDRESLAAHEAAIAEVAGGGGDRPAVAVVDGGRVRFVDAGGVAIATFPGVEHASQLVGGPDGCQHGATDAVALAQALAARPGLRVWAGWAAPRQQGPAASDLTADGIHVGERSLAAALAARPVALVLSAMVDEAAAGDGDTAIGGARERLHLAAGALEAAPGSASTALVVRMEKTRIKWRRLRVD